MESKGSKPISVSIPVELAEWLDDNKINKSKLFQEAALNLMNNRQSPILLLSSVMGICFGALLMVASIGLPFLNYYMMIVMFVMGIFVLGITLSVVINNVRRNAVSTNTVQ